MGYENFGRTDHDACYLVAWNDDAMVGHRISFNAHKVSVEYN